MDIKFVVEIIKVEGLIFLAIVKVSEIWCIKIMSEIYLVYCLIAFVVGIEYPLNILSKFSLTFPI